MNGSQFWELYQSYGDVYRQEVLSEEVEVEEGYVDAYKAPSNYRRLQGSSMLGHPANLSPAMRAMQKSDQLQTTEPGSKRQKAQTRSSQQLNRLYGSARRAGNVNASYEYDLYDVVLEHLLDEGFADTLEDAQVLMANMSEQWIDSIVEASEDYDAMSPEELHKEVTALDRRRRSGAPFPQNEHIRLANLSRRLKTARRGNSVVKKLAEDASTIEHYRDLASKATREGDKRMAEKYNTMIQRIQRTMSQRG
jgi:hypothetical protein